MFDDNMLFKIIVGLLAMLVGLLGWNLSTHKADYDKLKDDHNLHKLKVSEDYAKKTDLNAARQESTDSIRRLHEKIEDVNENLGEQISELPDKIVRLLKHS